MSEYLHKLRKITNSPIWQGRGSFRIGLLKMIWVGLRLWLAGQIWGTAVRLAHFAPPTNHIGIAAAIVSIILFAWGILGIWNTFTIFGIRRLMLMVLSLYILFLAVNVLTIPDDRPFAIRFVSQMGGTATSFGNTVVSTIESLFAAPDEFLFAYSGERNMPDLPQGFPTPDPEATSIVMLAATGDQPRRSLRPTPTFTTVKSVEARETTSAPLNASPSPTEYNLTPGSVPNNISVGSYVIISGTGGQSLMARLKPGTEQEIIARFPEGTILLVIDGPQIAGEFTWWKVQGKNGEGWCAENWIRTIEN